MRLIKSSSERDGDDRPGGSLNDPGKAAEDPFVGGGLGALAQQAPGGEGAQRRDERDRDTERQEHDADACGPGRPHEGGWEEHQADERDRDGPRGAAAWMGWIRSHGFGD